MCCTRALGSTAMSEWDWLRRLRRSGPEGAVVGGVSV
jgi:hypothetical protein